MTEPQKVLVVDRPGPEIPVVLVKQSPLMAVGIRVARTWLQCFVGFLLALGVGPDLLPVDQAILLAPFAAKLLIAAQLAVAPSVIALLQNALEVLTALDVTQPRLRG